MHQKFSLPISKGERIRVIYQKPDPPKKPEIDEDDEDSVQQALLDRIINRDVIAAPIPKPLIVMMHGFPGGHKNGPKDLFTQLEVRFNQLGYPSVRFDFRGCGDSDGLEEEFCLDSACEDLNAILQWAEHDAGHRSVILLGESLGATIGILGFNPKLIKALILLWPAITLKDTSFRALFDQEAQKASMKRDMDYVMFEGHRIGSHCKNDIYTTNLKDHLDKIDVPTLIQHGTADTDVPLAQAYLARDLLPGVVDVGVFEGGDHGLTAPNIRKHLFINIRYFLGRIAKKLEIDAKN